MSSAVVTAVSRRVIIRFGVALVAGIVLWLVLRPSEPRKVEHALRALAADASWDKSSDAPGRFARMRAHIEAATTDDLVVRIPDVPNLAGGRRRTLGVLYELYRDHVRGTLSVNDVDVMLDADGRGARAVADASLLLDDGQRTLTDARRVSIRLEKRDGGWRVAFVDVSAKPKDQPEARP